MEYVNDIQSMVQSFLSSLLLEKLADHVNAELTNDDNHLLRKMKKMIYLNLL